MKNIKSIFKTWKVVVLAFLLVSCNDFLDTKSFTIISGDDIWKDEQSISAILVNLYDNMQQEAFDYWQDNNVWMLMNPTSMSDEAQNSFQKIPLWDDAKLTYTYQDNLFDYFSPVYKAIYNCNAFLEQIDQTSVLTEKDKEMIKGEVRFIRAWHYFTLVKRYGGVPLITKRSQYTGPESIVQLQVPRDKESAIYDFIISETQEISKTLPKVRVAAEKYRITSGTALSLCSRAALYAGSISKYGTLNNTVFPSYNWIVGIDPTLANKYFQTSFEASKEVIDQGVYRLGDYNTMFTKTTDGNNGEYIFQRQYSVAENKSHSWDHRNTPFSYRHNGWGCGMAPTIEMIEAYECIDGSSGELKIEDEKGEPVKYANPLDLFKNKDPRLAASVFLPGSVCRGVPIEVYRGIINSKGETIYAKNQPGDVNDIYTDPVTQKKTPLSGKDGFSDIGDASKTGFYQKKYYDETLPVINAGKSETPWCVFRLGEMYLNMAEAGVELGEADKISAALTAVNEIRKRAGIKLRSTINMDQVRNERKVELAFEGLRFWDLKRWRIAHFDVKDGGLNGFSGTSLCPFLDTRDNTFIFKMNPNPPKRKRIFNVKNYYTAISRTDMNSNPALIQNPGYAN